MAGLVALAVQRLRLATIPAYLLAGALIGPGALGFVTNPEQVQKVADLAVILLMFGIGLHTDMDVLSRGLGRIAAGAVTMIVLCTLALWPAGIAMGIGTAPALVAGMAMSMSSTVVVLRVLQDRRQMQGTAGRITLAVLVIQDLAAIAMLLLLPPISQWAGTGGGGVMEQASAGIKHTGPFWTSPAFKGGLVAILGVAAIIGVGRVVMPRLLKEAARGKSGEVLTVIAMAAAMGAAGLTQLLGLNEALGAFLAGFLLAGTPFRHHLGGQVSAIRDVFGAIFFTAIGMSVSLLTLVQHLPTILIGTVVILIAKGVIISVVSWAMGTTGNTGIKLGASLAQAGEFSIVMLYAAKSQEIGLLSATAVGDMIAMVVVSLMVTPNLIQAADAVNRKLHRIPTAPWNKVTPLAEDVRAAAQAQAAHASGTTLPTAAPQKNAIIAGFGLVGRAVADELKKMNISTTIVEMNASTVEKQSSLGRKIVFGDIASAEVLETAGIEHADAMILTIPDTETVMRACKLAREMHPDIFILVRLNYVSQGIAAAGIGASGVVVEEMATAEAMERIVKKVLAGPGAPKV